jgi:hypothetical protein
MRRYGSEVTLEAYVCDLWTRIWVDRQLKRKAMFFNPLTECFYWK